MRGLVIVIAVTASLAFAGASVWKAEAAGAFGALPDASVAQQSPPVHPAACRGRGEHCPPGYHWVCGPNRCWCAPC